MAWLQACELPSAEGMEPLKYEESIYATMAEANKKRLRRARRFSKDVEIRFVQQKELPLIKGVATQEYADKLFRELAVVKYHHVCFLTKITHLVPAYKYTHDLAETSNR